MSLPTKTPKPKKCANPECAQIFTPSKMGQKVCGYVCGLAIAPSNRDRAVKALKQVDRLATRAARERIKSKGDHARDAQQAFNAWIRERDAALPCVSCGRHHEGQYHAGHFRTVAGSPELRFEPLNVHKQCAPCNNHKSGDIVNYRLELVRRIGLEKLEWLEGTHEPKRYTIEDLKAITAEYRLKLRQLRASI